MYTSIRKASMKRYVVYLLLGVEKVHHKGVTKGVDRNAAPSIKKSFINILNNPEKIAWFNPFTFEFVPKNDENTFEFVRFFKEITFEFVQSSV